MAFTSSYPVGLILTTIWCFGINPAWLEIDFHNVLTKGFTILFGGGEAKKLWFIYALMAIVPLLVESLPDAKSHPKSRRGLEFAALAVLVCLLPLTYSISRNAGIDRAVLDKRNSSSLPVINFTVNNR